MKFIATELLDVWRIDPELKRDDRGFFARAWCQQEFAEHGIDSRCLQTNIAFNLRRGTLRGLHYNTPPHEEGKLVRCVRGSLYAVMLDLRSASPTFERWAIAELTAENRRAVWVPKGCAFGYQTLADDTEVHYLMSDFYVPEAARGIRYNDPAFAIRWPLPVTAISEADQHWPAYCRT